MSALRPLSGAGPNEICSHRVFRILTRLRHQQACPCCGGEADFASTKERTNRYDATLCPGANMKRREFVVVGERGGYAVRVEHAGAGKTPQRRILMHLPPGGPPRH